MLKFYLQRRRRTRPRSRWFLEEAGLPYDRHTGTIAAQRASSNKSEFLGRSIQREAARHRR